MKRELFLRGYIIKEGRKYFTAKAFKKLKREGYINKEGNFKVASETATQKLRKGDLAITFEIFKVKGKFDKLDDEFRCVDVLPVCSTKICSLTGCGHECIKTLGLGQQGITKLLKWKK